MVRTQAREGVTTTREQAEAAYGKACALCGGRKADPDEDKFLAG